MKVPITIGVLIIMITSGFVIASYDRTDDGVKILNEDNYEDKDYSNPTYREGSQIVWRYSNEVPVKKIISKNEYNKIFSDYRDGLISKYEASQKLRSSKW